LKDPKVQQLVDPPPNTNVLFDSSTLFDSSNALLPYAYQVYRYLEAQTQPTAKAELAPDELLTARQPRVLDRILVSSSPASSSPTKNVQTRLTRALKLHRRQFVRRMQGSGVDSPKGSRLEKTLYLTLSRIVCWREFPLRENRSQPAVISLYEFKEIQNGKLVQTTDPPLDENTRLNIQHLVWGGGLAPKGRVYYGTYSQLSQRLQELKYTALFLDPYLTTSSTPAKTQTANVLNANYPIGSPPPRLQARASGKPAWGLTASLPKPPATAVYRPHRKQTSADRGKPYQRPPQKKAQALQRKREEARQALQREREEARQALQKKQKVFAQLYQVQRQGLANTDQQIELLWTAHELRPWLSEAEKKLIAQLRAQLCAETAHLALPLDTPRMDLGDPDLFWPTEEWELNPVDEEAPCLTCANNSTDVLCRVCQAELLNRVGTF